MPYGKRAASANPETQERRREYEKGLRFQRFHY